MKSLLFLPLLFVSFISLPAEKITIATLADNPLNEIFMKVYADAGMDVDLIIVPQKRMIDMVERGEAVTTVMADVNINMVFKSAVLRLGFGNDPLRVTNIYAYVRKEDEKILRDKSLWQFKTIGKVMGNELSKFYAEKTQSQAIVEAPTYLTALRMLESKRFDITFAVAGLFEAFIAANEMNIIRLEEPVDIVSLYHVMPAKYAGTDMEMMVRASLLKHRDLIDEELSKH